MIPRGTFFFIAAVLLLIASGVAWFTTQSTEWSVPLFVGAIASALAGLYQRWWVKSVFEPAPTTRRIPVRIGGRRHARARA